MQIRGLPNAYSGAIKSPNKLKSEGSDASASASKSLGPHWDEYIQKVKEFARQDALSGKNDYMSEEFHTFEKAYKEKYISPNRSKAISQVSSMLNSVTRSLKYGKNILNLFGLPYTADIHMGASRKTAEIFDEHGDMIAAYHSDSGWHSLPSQKEMDVSAITSTVYLEAYRAAKAELAATQTQGSSSASTASSVSANIDIKV